MSDTGQNSQVKLMRKLQFYGPIVMLLIGVMIYVLTPEWEMRNLVSGLVAFLAIPDFFTFKFLADQFEKNQ